MASLFDHLVGKPLEMQRHIEAQAFVAFKLEVREFNRDVFKVGQN
jgi:hypothetical protein